MRSYTPPSSRLVLPLLIGASSCSLLACTLFEPESHWECFNRDCSPIDSGTSGIGAGGSGVNNRDAGRDAAAPDSSTGGTADSGSGSQDSGGAVSACTDCSTDQVCDEAAGECVQCLDNDDCHSPTPVCTVDHRCVACTLDRHCPSTTPACNDDNTCVGCTDSALHCGDDKPLCDPARHECAQCLEDADCTDPAAAHCGDGTCVPCTGPLHCAHLDGLGICDTSSGSGECVQCTGTQYGACGIDSVTSRPFVCDSINRTCANRAEHSSGLCGGCVTDAECPSGQLCLLQEFESATIGYFCMWQRGAGVGGAPASCTTARPYRDTIVDAESIDGTTADVCTLRVSTCPAHADFDIETCSGATPTGDAQCGFDKADDGYCRALPAPDDGVFHCTTGCLTDDDCKIGSTCDTLVTPQVCTF